MAAIIIGLGGTGKVVLMKLRQMIVEEYGSLSNADIDFLHVDTYHLPTQEPQQAFNTEVLGVNIQLRSTERLVLSDGLPKPPLTARLTEHPNVRDWFPIGLPIIIDLAQGAGGIRPYGRLAFHYKVDKFINTLKGMIVKRGKSDIFIVCSLFGGTGCGIFLDVCYIVRDVVRQVGGESGELIGVFIIGATIPHSEMKNNCYAALKELEYYMTKHILTTTKTKDKELLELKDVALKSFEAHFPVYGVSPVISDEAPVDTCYLFGATNNHKKFERSELEEMVAKRIFLETIPGIGDPMRAQRVDIKSKIIFVTPDLLQQRAKTFFATGCSVIEFPAPRLMNALAAGFAGYCANYLIYEKADGFKDLNREIRNFIENQLTFKSGQMRRELVKQDTGTIWGSMKDDREGCLLELLEKVEDKSFDTDSIHPEAKSKAYKSVDSVNAGVGGTYVTTIDNNMEKLWKKIKSTSEGIIISFVTDSTIGPKHTVNFIEDVKKRLSKDKEEYRTYKESADTAVRKYKAEIERRLRHIEEDKKYRGFELRKHIQWLCRNELAVFMEQGGKRAIYERMETLTNRMIGFLEDKKTSIENYVENLRKIKSNFLGEMRKTCDNLLGAIKADPMSSVLFKELEEHIGQINKGITDNDPFIANYDNIVRGLLRSYDIADPFGGNIEGKARNTLSKVQNTITKINKEVDNIFYAAFKDPEDFKNKLFIECREMFNSVKDVGICELLVRKLNDAERDKLFDEKQKVAQYPLEVFTFDPTIQHDPNLFDKKWVGVPNEIDINTHGIWGGALASFDTQNQRFKAINENYRMVFATETGVFCLRNTEFINTYRDSFNSQSEDDMKKRQTRYRIDYPDIMAPDQRVPVIHMRAETAYLLGKIMGFLKERKNPVSGDNAIYLYYSDPKTAAEQTQEICERWEEVIDRLREKQVEKDIDKKTTEVAPLEILEREIRRTAESKKSRHEKDELRKLTESYLEERQKQIGGDNPEIHPAYKKDLEIINDFWKSYSLT
jgi:hypothetical protein